MSQRLPFYRTKGFNIGLGLAISAACLWLAVRGMIGDKQALMQIRVAFRDANYFTLPLILVDLALFYWLKAWRWRLMLAPIGRFRPAKDLIPPIMIGFAFNNVLPFRLGEVARCLAFSRQQRVPFTVSLSSVVLERVFDGVAIVTYLTVGLLFIEGVDPAIRHKAYLVAGASALVVLGGLVYVLWTAPFVALLEWLLAQVRVIPEGLRKKLCGLLEAGARGLSSLKDVRLLAGIIVISLIKWGLNGLLVLLALWSFQIQVPNPLAVSAVMLGVIAFGVAAPSSPGYFGVIQFCFMAVLKLFTDDQPTVFAASIYYHLSQYIPVTLVGLSYFMRSGLSMQQVESVEVPSPATNEAC